jgi:hypothetical protein
MVGSRATNQTSKTKIRQQEVFAWWDCRQEPDDDDEVMKDGKEIQDDDWQILR